MTGFAEHIVHMKYFLLAVFLCWGVEISAAQAEETFAELKTVGVGAIEADPDIASIPITVRVLDDDPGIVAERISTIISAVMDTLRSLGVDDSAIPGRSFAISTNHQSYQRDEPDYRADATLELTTRALDSLGVFVGAAIAAGATDISTIRFDTSERPRYREDALRLAVSAARREAQVVAEANGGSLHRLIRMTTLPETPFRNVYVEYERPLIQTDVLRPSSLTIEARVEATWMMGLDQ